MGKGAILCLADAFWQLFNGFCPSTQVSRNSATLDCTAELPYSLSLQRKDTSLAAMEGSAIQSNCKHALGQASMYWMWAALFPGVQSEFQLQPGAMLHLDHRVNRQSQQQQVSADGQSRLCGCSANGEGGLSQGVGKKRRSTHRVV